MKKKALILFSGGLDSRLAAKIMEEEGFEIELLFFKLPFGGGCCNKESCSFNFGQSSGFKLHIFDATKGNLFKKYLSLVKFPKYGTGSGMNPCKDCKIFIFKEGEKLRKKIKADILVSGEVLSQRPMSQMKSALLFNDKKSELEGKIFRPLSAKILPETIYEKKGLINRENFYAIQGRSRTNQIILAKKFKIKYPDSGGGCLLCDKDYSKKFKTLLRFKKNPSFKEISLLNNSRMFKDKGLIFVSRNEKESNFLESFERWNILNEKEIKGPIVIYQKKKDRLLAEELMTAYKNKDISLRKKFEKFKI